MTSADQDKLIRSWLPDRDSRETAAAKRNREHKIALMRHLAMLRFSGRIDELAKHLTDDCEMYLSGGLQSGPLSGRYVGRDKVIEKIGTLYRLFDFIEVEAVSTIIENDDLAVRWKCQARNRANGPSEWLEGMTVVHFRNDLVSYYGNFIDTVVLSKLVDLNLALAQ
jgi:hypothetical protein